MNHDRYDDAYIRAILEEVKTIAMVGASGNSARPSYFVLKYLTGRNYEVYPVNPGLAGKDILGRKVFTSLAEIPVAIDMIDIFRNSEAAGAIVDEALALNPPPKIIWMQLTVRNDAAAARAEAKGVTSGYEPLPENRIRKAFGRDRLARRQLARDYSEEADRRDRVPKAVDRAALSRVARRRPRYVIARSKATTRSRAKFTAPGLGWLRPDLIRGSLAMTALRGDAGSFGAVRNARPGQRRPHRSLLVDGASSNPRKPGEFAAVSAELRVAAHFVSATPAPRGQKSRRRGMRPRVPRRARPGIVCIPVVEPVVSW